MVDSDDKIVDRLHVAEAHVKYLDDIANKLNDRVGMLDPNAKPVSSPGLSPRRQHLEQVANSLSERLGALESQGTREPAPSSGDSLADAERKTAQLEHTAASLKQRMESFVVEYAKLEQIKSNDAARIQLESLADSLSARIKSLEADAKVVVAPETVENVEKQTRALESMAADLENRMRSIEQTPRSASSPQKTPRSPEKTPTKTSDVARDVVSVDTEALSSQMMMQLADAEKLKTNLEKIAAASPSRQAEGAKDQEIAILIQQSKAKDWDLNSCRDELDQERKVRSSLEEALEAQQMQAAQLHREIEELRTSLNRQSNQPPQQNLELEALVQDLQGKLTAAELQAAQSQREIGELRTCLNQQSDQPQQNLELDALVQDLQIQLTAATQELQAMATQLKQVQDESADAQYKNQLLLQEKGDLIAKLQNFQYEQQGMSSQMADEEKQLLQQQLDSYQARVAFFEQQSEELQRNAMQAQLEAKETKDMMQDEAVLKERILEENAKLRASSDVDYQTVSKLQAENLELTNRLSWASSDITQLDELRQNYDLLKIQYAALEAENGRLSIEAAEYQNNSRSVSVRKLESPVPPVTQTPMVMQATNESRTRNRGIRTEARILEQPRIAPVRRSSPLQAHSVILERPTYGNVVEPLERPTYANLGEPWFSTRSSGMASLGAPLGNTPGKVVRPTATVVPSSSYGLSANTLAGRSEVVEVLRPLGGYEATSVASLAPSPLAAGPPRSLKLSPYTHA